MFGQRQSSFKITNTAKKPGTVTMIPTTRTVYGRTMNVKFKRDELDNDDFVPIPVYKKGAAMRTTSGANIDMM